MSKPIFIVRVPGLYPNGEKKTTVQLIKDCQEAITSKGIASIKEAGYMCMGVPDATICNIQFRCFNVEDFEETTFDELKNYIDEKFSELETNN